MRSKTDMAHEAEYDERVAEECREVVTYKMTPDEIKRRYGRAKNGEKVSAPMQLTMKRKKSVDKK